MRRARSWHMRSVPQPGQHKHGGPATRTYGVNKDVDPKQTSPKRAMLLEASKITTSCTDVAAARATTWKQRHGPYCTLPGMRHLCSQRPLPMSSESAPDSAKIGPHRATCGKHRRLRSTIGRSRSKLQVEIHRCLAQLGKTPSMPARIRPNFARSSSSLGQTWPSSEAASKLVKLGSTSTDFDLPRCRPNWARNRPNEGDVDRTLGEVGKRQPASREGARSEVLVEHCGVHPSWIPGVGVGFGYILAARPFPTAQAFAPGKLAAVLLCAFRWSSTDLGAHSGANAANTRHALGRPFGAHTHGTQLELATGARNRGTHSRTT